MYKVFFNSNQITFGKEVPKSHNFTVVDEQLGAINFTSIIQSLFADEIQNFFIKTKNTDKIWQQFCSRFTQIKAAGGAVFNEEKEVLFIYRLGKWDLPKGKLEENENIKECAIREVEEECGITNVRITGREFCTYHAYILNNKTILKKTYWYRMEASKNQDLIPQTEEDITEVRWLGKDEMKLVLENTYENILLVLEDCGVL